MARGAARTANVRLRFFILASYSEGDPPSEVNATSEDRLRRIEAVTEAGLAYLDVEQLLVELLERVRELLRADTAAVLMLDSSSRQLVATAARGIEAEVRQGVRIPLGKGFAGRIAAEKRAVIIEKVDHRNVLNVVLLEKGIQSLLGVPLILPFYLYELSQGAHFASTPSNLAAIAYTAVFASLLAYLAWNHGVKVIGAAKAALSNYLMPVFTALLGWLLLGEGLQPYHWAGATLIFAGLLLATRPGKA